MTEPPTGTPALPGHEVLDIIQAIRDLVPRLNRAADGRFTHIGQHAAQIDEHLVRLLACSLPLQAIAHATGLPLQWVRTVRKNTGVQPKGRWMGPEPGRSPLLPPEQVDAARELSEVCRQMRALRARRDQLMMLLSNSGWNAPAIEPYCDLKRRRIQLILEEVRQANPRSEPDAP
jgi:hypothetical protein